MHNRTRLYRWGLLIANHPWRVLGVWLLAIGILAGGFSSNFSDNLTAVDGQIPGSETEEVENLLAERFGGEDIEADLLVFESSTLTAGDSEYAATVEAAMEAAAEHPLVVGSLSPYAQPEIQISENGVASFAILQLGGTATERQDASPEITELAEAEAEGTRVNVYFTGEAPLSADLDAQASEDLTRAETIGLPVAMIVLVLAFGAVVAAGLPILLALAGVGTTFGVLGIFSYYTDFVLITENITSLIGLGIGIDFAMFLVARFRESMANGAGVPDSVAQALDTSGRSILVSGGTTIIAVSGLLLVPGNIFADLAIGAMTTVAIMMAAALTLLPALLGKLGHRVNAGRIRRGTSLNESDPTNGSSGWARWTRWVMRRPVAFASFGLVIVIGAAIPALSMDLGLATGASAVEDRSSGAGLVVLGDHFSEGAISPIQVVMTSEDATPLEPELIASFAADIEERPAVAAAFVRNLSDDGTAVEIAAVPQFAIDDSRSEALVEALRSQQDPVGVTVAVGGLTAAAVDLSDTVQDKLPLVLTYVLVATFILLTVLFRSPLLSLKAILMNLLSVLAAYGLLVVAFQFGWAEGAFSFESPGIVQAYLPILAFAILFGISMDYEVFLLSRMREEWLKTGDNTEAVARGMTATARPITSAAAIQVAVFGAFVFTSVIDVKQVGFALATAIIVDALFVRVLLVPALMRLMGDWNWWSPKWMARSTA